MIFAIVVVYNKSCEQSESLKCIDKYAKDISVIVFDNSITSNTNKEYCALKGYTYYGFCKNYGISKAYNYCIDHCECKKNDYFIILDDDTCLTEEYFSEVRKLSNDNAIDVGLPIVIAGDILFSPSNVRFGCTSKIVKSREELRVEHITAINSGMFIRYSTFDKARYNEALFLDNVDHDFMKQVRNAKLLIYIMESKIIQNYSNFELMNLESVLKRYVIFKHDYKLFCKSADRLWFYYLYMIKHTLLLSIRYKTIKFITLLFHNE